MGIGWIGMQFFWSGLSNALLHGGHIVTGHIRVFVGGGLPEQRDDVLRLHPRITGQRIVLKQREADVSVRPAMPRA